MSHLFALLNQRDTVSTPMADLVHENIHLSSSMDLETNTSHVGIHLLAQKRVDLSLFLEYVLILVLFHITSIEEI